MQRAELFGRLAHEVALTHEDLVTLWRGPSYAERLARSLAVCGELLGRLGIILRLGEGVGGAPVAQRRPSCRAERVREPASWSEWCLCRQAATGAPTRFAATAGPTESGTDARPNPEWSSSSFSAVSAGVPERRQSRSGPTALSTIGLVRWASEAWARCRKRARATLCLALCA